MPKAILVLLTLSLLAACEAPMSGGPTDARETDDASLVEVIPPTEPVVTQ